MTYKKPSEYIRQAIGRVRQGHGALKSAKDVYCALGVIGCQSGLIPDFVDYTNDRMYYDAIKEAFPSLTEQIPVPEEIRATTDEEDSILHIVCRLNDNNGDFLNIAEFLESTGN